MWYKLFQFIRVHGPILILYTLYFSVLSIGLRYPTSTNLSLVPLDPNFPLHALAGLDLSDGGTGFVNSRLEWPDGAPIRYLAWPLLLCSQIFEQHFDAVPAFHLGILAWLTTQGVLMVYLFQDLLQERLRSLSAATLALCAPQVLIALGNAQFENVAPALLLLIGWSVVRQKYFWVFFSLLGACFSSPYMGFLGLLLAMVIGFKEKWVWLCMIISSGCLWWYYDAVISGGIHESTRPAPAVMSESANLLGLFSPVNIAENGGSELPNAIERLHLLQSNVSEVVLDEKWFWVMVTASSFLGLSWLILGLTGLWQKRHDPIIRSLTIWSLISLLCAFGNELVVETETIDIAIPWIWSVTEYIPGLANMNATYRFLMAPSLLLALGIACVGNRGLLVLGTLFCILEALFISPAHWPIPSKQPVIPEEIATIQKPFIFWPPPPVISSYKVTMTSLLLNQPIAMFSAQKASMPTADGTIPELKLTTDRQGRTINQWTQIAIDNDITYLIEYRGYHELNGPPPIRIHQRKCYTSYCLSLLTHEKPEN